MCVFLHLRVTMYNGIFERFYYGTWNVCLQKCWCTIIDIRVFACWRVVTPMIMLLRLFVKSTCLIGQTNEATSTYSICSYHNNTSDKRSIFTQHISAHTQLRVLLSIKYSPAVWLQVVAVFDVFFLVVVVVIEDDLAACYAAPLESNCNPISSMRMCTNWILWFSDVMRISQSQTEKRDIDESWTASFMCYVMQKYVRVVVWRYASLVPHMPLCNIDVSTHSDVREVTDVNTRNIKHWSWRQILSISRNWITVWWLPENDDMT